MRFGLPSLSYLRRITERKSERNTERKSERNTERKSERNTEQKMQSQFEPKKIYMSFICLAALVVSIGALRTSYVVQALFDTQEQVGQHAPIGNEISGQLSWVERQKRGSVAFFRVGPNEDEYSLFRLYGRATYATTLKIGCFYRLKIKPISIVGEQVIGGYNARRAAFFSNEIGRGFIDRVVEHSCDEAQARQIEYWGPKMSWSKRRLAEIRYDIGKRYREAMTADDALGDDQAVDRSNTASAIAIALITGMRQAIPENIRQDFRASGLAHVLAISGLHMALFAGSVYSLLRFVFALFPRVNQRFEIRKICAVLALLAATAYFLLSGASYATQRAYIMIACMFLAILIGRPAISLNNVAISAIVILWLRPDALFGPGFQMSFAAVLALVRSYELWARYKVTAKKLDVTTRRSYGAAIGHWGSAFMLGLLATSFIAGLVTSFVGLAHFGTMAKYGLLANVLAMPVFVFLVMPLAVISLVLMPTPLFDPVVQVLAISIEWVSAIANWVSRFPDPQIFVTQFHGSYLVILFAGLCLFCWSDVIQSKLLPRNASSFGIRSIAINLSIVSIVLSALALSASAGRRPDIYILGRGYEVAIRDRAGSLKLLTTGSKTFVVKKWFSAEGDGPYAVLQSAVRLPKNAKGAKGASPFCQRSYCRIESLDGQRIDIAYSYKAREIGCEDANLVISYLQKPRNCAAQYFQIPEVDRNEVIAGFYNSNQPSNWRFINLNDNDKGAWQKVKRYGG